MWAQMQGQKQEAFCVLKQAWALTVWAQMQRQHTGALLSSSPPCPESPPLPMPPPHPGEILTHAGVGVVTSQQGHTLSTPLDPSPVLPLTPPQGCSLTLA